MQTRKEPHFLNYLRDEGLKWTPEREKVYEEALSTDGHFEAEELAFRLRKSGSRISKATVYRTLPLLVKAGLLKEVIYGEKHRHYEHVHEGEQHDHLVCLRCGRIIEFEDESLIKEIEERVCKGNHFEPQKVLVEVFGYCKKCQ